MTTIELNAANLALERCDGASFEKFAQAFLSASLGREFVPLGGYKDGGADGFVANADEPTEHFMQASIETTYAQKIRRTVKRLEEVGRKVRRLTYLSSQTIRMLDKEEEALSEELGVIVRIRDRKFICDNLNATTQGVTAFNSYLAQHLAFLTNIGAATIIAAKSPIAPRTLCVFLGQEVERRQGKTSLLESVVDSLILWALEGTDPDKNIFRGRQELLSKIEEALPSARQFIRNELGRRLEVLSKRVNPTGREIRWHRKEDKFCLPYETRVLVTQENMEDETLRLRVTEIFKERAQREVPTLREGMDATVAAACHLTLELTFYKQGMELAGFISGSLDGDDLAPSIQDNARTTIKEMSVGADGAAIEDGVIRVLRGAFYDSTSEEREYMGKLSRTYFLMCSLNNEPRIVEYFQSMAASLNLYVGSDLLVRAMSERYLKPADQAMRTCLQVLASAGAKLILTEKVIEEVITHLIAQDSEYQNHYAQIDSVMNLAIASQVDRILIRAYFYARLDKDAGAKRPANWTAFLGQFCSYADLRRPAGVDSLRRSLQEEYGLDYESSEQMESSIDRAEAEQLGKTIEAARPRKGERGELLALNDAIQVLRIYSKREAGGEFGRGNPFGYKTWWLTKEVAVLRAASALVETKRAAFWMRPEFVLNFIALAPSKQSVLDSYKSVFPSLLGVRLANRVRPEIVRDFEKRIKEASEISDARARAQVAELSDTLKSDAHKHYEHNL